VKRVLVLRAQRDAERTAAKLREMGHESVLSPIMEVVATGATIPYGDFDALLVSSAKGVENASDTRSIQGLPLHVVGAMTARAAEAAGWTPDLVAGNAQALLPLLLARYQTPANFLYLAGRDRQGDLEQGLRDAGHDVIIVEAYDARAASALSAEALQALREGSVSTLLHYSKRSVEIFLALAQAAGVTERLRPLDHLALSQDVAAPLAEALGVTPRVAAKPDEAALLALLENA